MKNLKIYSALFVVQLFCISAFAQNWWGKGAIKGEGPIIEKTLDVSDFTGVSLGISGNVILKQGNQTSVVVEGQQNIIDNIQTDVYGDVWRIRYDKNVRNHKRVTIYITMPTLTEAYVSGSGGMKSKGAFSNLGDLELAVSGSGKLSLDVDAKTIESAISGSGDIHLAGNSHEMEVQISGSGELEGFNMQTKDCNIRISGSGECEISVAENLEVKVSGSGDVFYKGNPRVRSKISGSGDVVSRN